MSKKLTRRAFARLAAAAAMVPDIPWVQARAAEPAAQERAPVDRRSLVSRHNVIVRVADVMSPLSVGNGEFAFTADITGLQTFSEEYREGIPLGTMAQWGFHTAPNPEGFSLRRFPLTYIDTSGRRVGYLYYEKGKSPAAWGAAADYLYDNPSRMNLGRVGLCLKWKDGRTARLGDITDIHQELDLWKGRLSSSFRFDGQSVRVTTTCHPGQAQLGVSIESPLIADERLAVRIDFPYAAGTFSGDGADWNHPELHQTVLSRPHARRADFHRQLNDDHYEAAVEWEDDATFTQTAPHEFFLVGKARKTRLSFSVSFAQEKVETKLASPGGVAAAAESMWQDFWQSGGAIDLSASRDSRWRELERRIVLSQYLTRIQSAGSLPPQETGLTCNSWCGKFHLEMHWWHAAHFALWGRHQLLERSLPFYENILPKARAQASSQGYGGARWPKCVGPSGDPAPTYLECFLIWQQPHPIFYAELCYRAAPVQQTLLRYKEVVLNTAEFMASFAVWDSARRQYRIGPPIADAAEIYFKDHEHQWNPTFETAYWQFGLEIAQQWRVRLGVGRMASWDHVLNHLPPLAVRDGLYVGGETANDTFRTPGRNISHPTMLAAMGMLPGEMVDPEIMRRTLSRIMGGWDWKSTWGWDYPLIAMAAARLGEPSAAIDALLLPEAKNTFLANGHNFQMPHILPIYLPGNGGLLYAVAMMTAGWDGAPGKQTPGFPDDGSWAVHWDGLLCAP
jgi:protein-glucosylgalactosylhydroxylysine glucosidase